jgi:arylsulfatase
VNQRFLCQFGNEERTSNHESRKAPSPEQVARGSRDGARTAPQAQETAGSPGLPSAPAAGDGTYLPNPPWKFFEGEQPECQDSKPYWPPNIVPPKGARNVLLIMTNETT